MPPKQINEVDEPIWRRLKILCAVRGHSLTHVINRLIEDEVRKAEATGELPPAVR